MRNPDEFVGKVRPHKYYNAPVVGRDPPHLTDVTVIHRERGVIPGCKGESKIAFGDLPHVAESIDVHLLSLRAK